FSGLLQRVAKHGEQVHLSSKMLSLSDTPDGVRKAANRLTTGIQKEFGKLTMQSVEPRDWEGFHSKVDRLEELMKKDMGSYH
ncbi:MAG: hypothetical protein L3K07_04040, partial [Thermoplasmata archaeon]|nr:hypothetical protein [Thermoplasmata archaeon]